MPFSAHSLDVRPMPPSERHPRIFQTFDALSPGEGFVLINDHSPKPLLYQFQFERAREFDWNVLESGPADFRVEIRKRSGTEFRNISEYLEGDHLRLDALLNEAVTMVIAGDFAGASLRFSEFICGLETHIAREEKILFPVFEKATGMSEGGPTGVMRAEHIHIRQALQQARAALEAEDEGNFQKVRAALLAVLEPHNVKEESILYPACDRAAGGEHERDELVRRMQAF